MAGAGQPAGLCHDANDDDTHVGELSLVGSAEIQDGLPWLRSEIHRTPSVSDLGDGRQLPTLKWLFLIAKW